KAEVAGSNPAGSTHRTKTTDIVSVVFVLNSLLVVASNALMCLGHNSARLTREQTGFVKVSCPTSAHGHQGRNSYTSIPAVGYKPDSLVDNIFSFPKE